MRKNRLRSAEGIYLRGDTWWVRFSFGGRQVRKSLETSEESRAIERAAEVRENHGRRVGHSDGWEKSIARYLVEKQRPQRPPGFKGTWRTFRPKTAASVGYALRPFAKWTGTRSPGEVTTGHLEQYLALHSKRSKAGGKTTIATIQAFLTHLGCSPGKIQLPAARELESRKLVYSVSESNEFIRGTENFVRLGRAGAAAPRSERSLAIEEDVNLKTRFVLTCGFWAGLRSNEIRHAKPSWFRLDSGILRVPAKDELFESKDGESREIPLSAEFVSFLRGYLKGKPSTEFILKSRKSQKSRDGTYDFKRPVGDYMSGIGHPEFYPHAMRHSWITELVNSGNHTLQEVAAWSGDNLETIESNYWKKRVVAGSIDATLRGERNQEKQAQQIEDMVGKLGELLEASKGPKRVKALQKISEFVKRHDSSLGELLPTVGSSRRSSNDINTRTVWARAKAER